jgi:hypothetical protein
LHCIYIRVCLEIFFSSAGSSFAKAGVNITYVLRSQAKHNSCPQGDRIVLKSLTFIVIKLAGARIPHNRKF